MQKTVTAQSLVALLGKFKMDTVTPTIVVEHAFPEPEPLHDLSDQGWL